MSATPLEVQQRTSEHGPNVGLRGTVGTTVVLAAVVAAASWPVAVLAAATLLLALLAARRRWLPSSARSDRGGTRRDGSRSARVDPR